MRISKRLAFCDFVVDVVLHVEVGFPLLGLGDLRCDLLRRLDPRLQLLLVVLVQILNLELVLVRQDREDELQSVACLSLLDLSPYHVYSPLSFLLLLRLPLGLRLVPPLFLCPRYGALLCCPLLLDLLEFRGAFGVGLLRSGLHGVRWLDHEPLSHPGTPLFLVLALSLHAQAEALHAVNQEATLDFLVLPGVCGEARHLVDLDQERA